MLNTLIIGFGRAGSGLHWPALRKMMQPLQDAETRPIGRVFVFDAQMAQLSRDIPDGVIIVPSYDDIRSMVDPRDTVVHVCTPPQGRADTVARLAADGFRRFLLEKPLADTVAEVAALDSLRQKHELDFLVMGNFIVSVITERIASLIETGAHGTIRRLSFVQSKPRFAKSLANRDHPTAFDVEVPHAVGAALLLAGVEVEVLDAHCSDLLALGRRIPLLGTAQLTVRHLRDGAVTEIVSNLASPIRERSVRVHLDDGQQIIGHYPVSERDHHAQLALLDRAGRELHREVLVDDSILTFLVRTYRYFEGTGERPRSDFALNSAIVRLISDAKLRCGVTIPTPDRDTIARGTA